MASAQMEDEIKLYLHAQTEERSAVFLLEVNYNLRSQMMSFTMKTDRVDLTEEFRRLLNEKEVPIVTPPETPQLSPASVVARTSPSGELELYPVEAFHEGKRTFRCPKCDKTFASKQNVDRHIGVSILLLYLLGKF